MAYSVFLPRLSVSQQQDLDRLEKIYDKPAVLRMADGVGNLIISGGAFSRADADKLSKIAKVFLDENKALNNDIYAGINPEDQTKALELISLYNKAEGWKFLDGIGNFFFAGTFGRSDALDLVRIIKHVRAANQAIIVVKNSQRLAYTSLERSVQNLQSAVQNIN